MEAGFRTLLPSGLPSPLTPVREVALPSASPSSPSVSHWRMVESGGSKNKKFHSFRFFFAICFLLILFIDYQDIFISVLLVSLASFIVI